MKTKDLWIRGARVHNLKNVDVRIPRNALVVFTGPSGSGKSSLAFDTIYAEGQRRYIESLSVYARQFVQQLDVPEIDSIVGLSPTLCIEQRTSTYNLRSTVGTVTELQDYLRLLYARIGIAFCWKCHVLVQAQLPFQIIESILALAEGSVVVILAPLVQGRKGEHQKDLVFARQKGFARVCIDGEIFDLSSTIRLDKHKKHDIDVYIDRFTMKASLFERVQESVELALQMGKGVLVLEVDGCRKVLSEKLACPQCQTGFLHPEPRTFSFNSPAGACPQCTGLGVDPEVPEGSICSLCLGARFRKESLCFQVGGLNLAELSQLPLSELPAFFQDLKLSSQEVLLAQRILDEIQKRLGFLLQVGLGYLSLSRSAQTLSGGEIQRIRLTTQIGSSLVGVIYVLDEPSIGLHQKDHHKLLQSLFKLRDLGNTVLVVEHDRDTIENADWIVDLGPGAGVHGGSVIASGPLSTILKSKKSLTGKYLRGDLRIELPEKRRVAHQVLRLEGVTKNNLKEIDVEIPLGVFTCVTGVSGSGKSSLVLNTVYPLVHAFLNKEAISPSDFELRSFSGLENLDKVVDVDQSPIGQRPRSNPATYTGLFQFIRELFAQLPESKIRGYGSGRYSFNVEGGRCQACEGDGMKKIEMHFLPPVFVPCEVCHTTRYSADTLAVRYKGKNIAEVLDMTVEDALVFFDAVSFLKAKLETLNEVGLGYLKLGQSSTTLSGGEAQRIKLAKELAKRGTGKTIYILDEPSTGLHFDDVNKLVEILQRLVDRGNTVLVIEHHLDIIKMADYLIDLGPEGGVCGGSLLATGTPEEVARNPRSVTGPFLRSYL